MGLYFHGLGGEHASSLGLSLDSLIQEGARRLKGMKTQRRHELQTNQLAAWFSSAVNRARPHGNLIATGCVVVLVALLAGNFLARRSKARAAAAWTALTTANTSPELAAVGNDFPGSPAGAWGTLRSADREFARGMQGLFIDREGALVNLRSAQRTYEKLAGSSPDSPLVNQRASFGLAKSYETLGEIEEATRAYQSLVDRFPAGPFADQAKARIDSLKDPETGEFYAWLEKQSSGASSDTPATETSSTSEESGPSDNVSQLLDNLNPSLPSTEENASDSKSTQPDPDQAPDGEATPREDSEAASEKEQEPTAPAESTAKDAAPESDPSPSPETVPSSDAPVKPEGEEAPTSEEETTPSSDES